MPFLSEDAWIDGQATTHDIAELEDCAIAVDATYYLGQLLNQPPAHEPLLPALSGLTGIESHINENLDLWAKFRITPLFIFNGQSLSGQEEVSLARGRAANVKTNDAWSLYSGNQAEPAVAAFGANPGAFQLEKLYPLLQRIIRQRDLHFLVSPYNACAQLAYFEMIDSDQCAGVMGPQELLLYPIKDSVIRNFDWNAKTVTGISKKKVMRVLGVTEPMFIDAKLMAGTTFLPTFPTLLDTSMYPNRHSIMDAVNVLRTSDKAVANACASFHDILQVQDPNWLDKYRKARMIVQHFIYIAENGEVRVNDLDRLTKDNHEYLGLQMPAELFHYLNTGLISPRILSCITNSQILILPTLDGVATDPYKKLVTTTVLSVLEQAIALIIPRVHRGIGHKDITLRVWFDPKYAHTINHRSLQPPPSQIVSSWNVKEGDLRDFFPADFGGPVYQEVLALANPEFAAKTFAKEKEKPIRGIDSTEMVTSVAIWRFLHLRDYVNNEHKLTKWGNALATALLAIRDASEGLSEVPGIDEAVLLAFELIRAGLLTGKYVDGSPGQPRKGTDEEKSSIVLISQCASFLKLNHSVYGYTGPLNKGLLGFRALSTTVREADRDLLESIVASMFMYGQCKRERDDYLEISQRLPFLEEPDLGLGIAIHTFFDEDEPSDGKEKRAARLAEFPKTFVPLAVSLSSDFRVAADFFNSLNQGIQTLDIKEFSSGDKAAWARAQEFLDARPF